MTEKNKTQMLAHAYQPCRGRGAADTRSDDVRPRHAQEMKISPARANGAAIELDRVFAGEQRGGREHRAAPGPLPLEPDRPPAAGVR